ncbi:MAG: EAL domain-containing protein, partial [Xanthomonadaceae bacterium]|nr:EAL domain-containing protein [Xanthomonadaceae bacterium]
QWRVHFSSADAEHQIVGARRAQLLLQGGIVTAALLALLVWLLGTTRIRARVLAEDMASAYRDSEQRLRTITDNLPGLVSYLDAEGRFGFVNRTHDEWFGIPAREFIGKTFIEVFGADAPRDPAVDALVQRGHDGERGSMRSWLPQAGRWVHVSVVPDLHSEGVAGVYMLLVDVTALKLAEDALFAERDRAQTTLRAIADAVIVTDASGRISYVNPTAEVITGCASGDAVGQHVDDVFRVIAADTGARIVDPLTLALRENRIRTLPTDALLQQRGGASVAVEDSAAPIHDRDGNVTGAVIVFRDVSASRELALRMAHMAQHDPLTDLPNRLLLEDRLRQAIALAERNARAAAVLFIDLDRFKLINDSLGHAVGDRLLQHVARVLVSCVRRSDTVCRLGGDEFVVLLPEINGPRDAMHVADKLLTALQTPVVLDGDELRVSCSIGISMFPSDGADPPTLLKNADAAMYHAKHGGRNRHAFFTDEINERAHARLQTETRLQRAIEVGELRLHYQPKVDSRSGRLIGLEALVRWQREPDRLCQPAEFLPIAEDSGLIAEVDAWVLRQALAQLRAWRELGLPVVPVAVNLSVTHFSDDRLLELVGDALAAAGLAPSMLQIEITESQLLRNTERTQRLLASLKRLGVGIAIDDFGTGYSSLGYLCRFPVDVLKIDRSFVATMAEDRRQAVIVQAITGMAKTLGYRVVAEGVEREIEAQMLRADACDELQGFLYSRPLPPDDCAALLQRSAVAGERSMWPGFAAP